MLKYELWQQLEFGENIEAFEQAKSKKYFTIAICLNFAEDNKQGCDAGCKFCHWRSLNFNPYLCPTNELLIEFINKFSREDGIVELTGGGDPLYNFEKNKYEIKRLIDVIISCNRQPKIVTKKINIVKQYINTKFLKGVLHYSFSCEDLSEDNLTFFQSLLAKNIKVRVSKIYNFGNDQSTVNYQDIYKTINFYNKLNNSNFRLTLRSNYSFPNFDFRTERTKLNKYLEKNAINIEVKLNGIIVHMPQLIGNDVLYCSNIEQYLNLFSKGAT